MKNILNNFIHQLKSSYPITLMGALGYSLFIQLIVFDNINIVQINQYDLLSTIVRLNLILFWCNFIVASIYINWQIKLIYINKTGIRSSDFYRIIPYILIYVTILYLLVGWTQHIKRRYVKLFRIISLLFYACGKVINNIQLWVKVCNILIHPPS